MVILFAANNYFVNGKATQGFPIYLHRVTTSLAKFGHTPIIVACGTENRHYVKEGVEIYIIRCVPLEIAIKSIEEGYKVFYRSRKINRKIGEITREKAVDIIQFTSLQGLAVCYKEKIPAVMRLSSYAKVAYEVCQTFDERQIKIRAFFERMAAGRCHAIFAPCQNTADAFSHDIGRKVSVIESPFVNDVAIYDESIYEKKLRDKKYVLYFGRMYAEKGILVIADILQKFLESNPEYYMVCCGQAENINGKSCVNILKEASGNCRERFIYIEALPHEKLYPIIRRADFIILPSFSENLSNACIEAMHFERVVIGTDGASFEQLIEDGKSGLLCQRNDARSLLDKMNEAAAMTGEQKIEIGRQAKRRIDRLSPDLVVKKLIGYYRYIIHMYRKG